LRPSRYWFGVILNSRVAISDSYVERILHGDLVGNGSTAVAVAEIIIRANYGDDVLSEQRPLLVSDRGEYWLVEGSRNASRAVEGPGKVVVRLSKADARVISLL